MWLIARKDSLYSKRGWVEVLDDKNGEMMGFETCEEAQHYINANGFCGCKAIHVRVLLKQIGGYHDRSKND